MSPAPPTGSRAVIVGLEKYNLHTLRGPVAEALAIARTLGDIGVPAGRIDLWLAPADYTSRQLAESSGFAWKPFEEQAFIDYLDQDLADDAKGGTLYVHWCGHGLTVPGGTARNPAHEHHLLLPRSTDRRLDTLDLGALVDLLVDLDHARFGHVVFVVDTCRESVETWGPLRPVPCNLGVNGRANGPLACKLFVCAEGQTTTYTAMGSKQGEVLRAVLRQATPEAWRDFKSALQDAAVQLELQDGQVAVPYVYATDWFGEPLNWAREPALDVVFSSAPVDLSTQSRLAFLSLRPELPLKACRDLPELLAFLANLPTTQGVAPLHEFAVRLLGACDQDQAKPLRKWVADKVQPSERAGIEQRLKAGPPLCVLRLWVDEDPDADPAAPAWRVKGELCDAVGAPQHRPGRPRPDRVDIVTDRSQLRRVLHDWMMSLIYGCKWKKRPVTGIDEAIPRLVELFLPENLLAEGIERETLYFEGEWLDLAVQYPTILRNGRQAHTGHSAWKQLAGPLLGRWARAQPLAHVAEQDVPQPALAFLRDDGPVWCLVPDAKAQPAQLVESHRLCIKNGLPALVWTCGRPLPGPPDLPARLDLNLRGPADAVSERLVGLRRGGLFDLSVMFDDPARPPSWASRPGQAGT